MANDLGLPAVPRGLDRELRFFLQNLVSVVGRLAGLTPGSKSTRAVRVSESSSLSGGTSPVTGSITTTHLADLSVTTRKLADKCVTAEKLAPSSVDGKALKAGEVGADALAPFCVTSEKIANGTVTGDKLAQGAVTTSALAAGAVGEEVLDDGAVGTAHLQDGAVSITKLAADARTSVVLGEKPTTDGEAVDIPAIWYGRPAVMLVSILSDGVPVSGVKCGVVGMREAMDADGNGTGVWRFTAVGSFTWAAIGYVRTFLTTDEEGA